MVGMHPIASVAIGLGVGLVVGFIFLFVRSGIRYTKTTNERIARGKALLVEHGIVTEDDDPWGVDVDFANELLDAREAHPDTKLFIRAISGATTGRFDSNAQVLAERHPVDDMGCIPFCGALLVTGLGVDTPRGFVPADSDDAGRVWSEYLRLISRLEQLNEAAERMCRDELERIAAGGFATDAVLNVAAWDPRVGGRRRAPGPVIHTVR